MREVSRELGLPNWNHAASPCLRSRLAFGVQATPERLVLVEKVRDVMQLVGANGFGLTRSFAALEFTLYLTRMGENMFYLL